MVLKTSFGNFNYKIPIVAVDASSDELLLAFSKFNSEVKDEKIELDRQIYALTATSGVHEIRHFFDFFGTFSGISVWFEYISLLQRFTEYSEYLSANKLKWTLPSNEKKDETKTINKFIRQYKAFDKTFEFYNKPFTPYRHKGLLDSHYFSIENKPFGEAKAFAFTIRQDEEYEVQPIGFEALLEGNALAVQRSNLNTKDDNLYLKKMAKDGGFVPPYYVTDLMITKYLGKYNKPSFKRDTILAITDLTLSQSSIASHELPFENASAYLIDGKLDEQFVRTLEEQPIDNIVTGQIEYPDAITSRYEKLLIDIRNSPKIDNINSIESPSMGIEIVKRYVFHYIIVPLLEERINTNHKAFTTTKGFGELFLKYGIPPIFVSKNGIYDKNLPQIVAIGWKHLAMISEIVDQIVYKNEIVTCPRLKESVSGIEFINYSLKHGENCSNWIPRGCGEWYQGSEAKLPNCVFSELLNHLAIK